MIKQRLAELHSNATKWSSPDRSSLSPKPKFKPKDMSEFEETSPVKDGSQECSIENETARLTNKLTSCLSTFNKQQEQNSMAKDEHTMDDSGPEMDTGAFRRGVLEERKNKLLKSSERWRSRVKQDPQLENLEAITRMRKDHQKSPVILKNPAGVAATQGIRTTPTVNIVNINTGLDSFYETPSPMTNGGGISPPTTCGISPPSKVMYIFDATLDEIARSTPRLTVPTRALSRRRMGGRLAALKLPELTAPTISSAPVTPLNYRLKREQSNEDMADPHIATSAKRGLQSKLDYSAVRLKKAEVKSPYPELMLIRVKGEKYPDARLVAPKISSVHAYAVFVLLTPSRIMLYNGKYANLIEKTKARQLVTSVCSKNGELGCYAKHSEEVIEGRGTDFWALLRDPNRNTISRPVPITVSGTDGEILAGTEEIQMEESVEEEEDFMKDIPDEDYVPEELLEMTEPFESVMAGTNLVFKIAEYNAASVFSAAETPKYSMFHPSSNLVFDFGSEIYVWAGRNADRNGTRQAHAYAEQLRTQSAPHIKNSTLLFGDSFDEARPSWCIVIKLAQGLGDALFRHKFNDWKSSESVAHMAAGKWKPKLPKQIVLNMVEEQALALKLGESLSANSPCESVLVLEETDLPRNGDGVFTEGLEFMVLQGETDLVPLEALSRFESDQCYVVKWQYRIERTGIRKLDGGKIEHDTGRQRVAFFYWLGANTSKKQQGLCALALRDLDRERHPHERILQDQVPPQFLQLFNGSMMVTGPGTKTFVVLGSSIQSEYRMVELTEPVVFRSHGIYVKVEGDTVILWYGIQTKKFWRESALDLVKKLMGLYDAAQYLVPSGGGNSNLNLVEQYEGEGLGVERVIAAENWEQAPRLIRIYETDGKDLHCAQWDSQMAFSFHQRDLRDTMLVDQGTSLWLWTEEVVSTYALRVAIAYWANRRGSKKVICKSREPDTFKALFPEWQDFLEDDGKDSMETNQETVVERHDVCDLDELLKLRTQHFPLEKVVARDLPSGVDMKRLEQYLTDEDFWATFGRDRPAFYALPQWKQIELRKQHQLF